MRRSPQRREGPRRRPPASRRWRRCRPRRSALRHGRAAGRSLMRTQPSSMAMKIQFDCPAPAAIPAFLRSQLRLRIAKRVDRTVQTTRIVFEPTGRNNVQRRHAQHRSQCRAILPGRSLGPGGRPLCLGLPGDDRQPVRRIREAAGALLAHHRRHRATSRRCAAPASSANSRNSIPATAIQYTSGCPLSTPSGIMVGSYTMRNARGEMFEIDIPAFSLDIPGKSRTVN